ncbi:MULTISPECIES: SRPBCC family protein [Streptomyces]|uniref:SRPBCC family protein n=1 Tax=Streptomyces TaxID=1883 RepID=UPI00207A3344|nr:MULTISPECIES: SRPBCC family protein [Streptomyces]MCM9080822.1 SRPBCC family protein [Streptomyces spororaveus]MCX5304752.1 SRPBCC domain-containing protein [Streptomyces sp. NBC_00160]
MEHQVFVPVPADDLRAVLRDPSRVARCVPGLQQDADTDAGPVSGRLKVRVGGSTVTYRGALSVTERDPGHFTFDGEGTEARGSGTVKFTVDLRLAPVADGTRLDFTAAATADGRAAAFPPEAAATAVRRLLDRAAGQLTLGALPDAVSDPVAEAEEAEGGEGAEGPGFVEGDVTEITASLFETDVPPPSLDPFLAGRFEGSDGAPRPPAEAAHARRTMIGRSAEEVDHAPPRGRYAPVPAPASAGAGDSLRWIAPAAAFALASAVVIGRALRRRR